MRLDFWRKHPTERELAEAPRIRVEDDRVWIEKRCLGCGAVIERQSGCKDQAASVKWLYRNWTCPPEWDDITFYGYMPGHAARCKAMVAVTQAYWFVPYGELLAGLK